MDPNRRRGRPKANDERDLRATLLDTSRLLLDEVGPGGLSMREVSRRAGCTHQAPYHYFENRESILAALVSAGFDELARGLAAANQRAATEGVRCALLASGRAYVDFALSQRGVFRIMFRPDLCNPSRFPDVQATGKRARAELTRLSQIVSDDPSRQVALETILWAHVHGLACLLIDGPLGAGHETEAQIRCDVRKLPEAFADMVLNSFRAGD